ncbi:hypothetical protein [Glutamicibacter sp.]|uniref:hypothetical protein n=1 Tax=Glutamicibacter sp. TaxID=1931995 RepID=UPI002B4A15F8|nr:hypothetical protein [Glutamicibacter sp.]HJX78549.1 hypothetical protein [Glutamicibacter sp.]
MTNEIEPPDASGFEVGVAKIFPKGVGIGIIGGSDNHVTNSVVRGWSNGVGIGVFDSPGSTVENSDVSDGTTEK